MSKIEADLGTLRSIENLNIDPYMSDDVVLPYMRGAAPDLEEDYTTSEDSNTVSPHIKPNGEGTQLYNDFKTKSRPLSVIGKVSAMNIPSDELPYDESGYDGDTKPEYIDKFQTWQDLCTIYTDIKSETGNHSHYSDNKKYRVPGYEYYPDDFLYAGYTGYALNRMITLRRFPYPCIDNIFSNKVQPNQDITRMITFIDNNINPFSDILSFSYGLRWKQLSAGMESMQMQGDQEGLSGFMKKTATFLGDDELIKNRLRGPNGNQIPPDHDANKAHGPVDSITDTHIRDVGMDFDKEFSIEFYYKARSYGGRNADLVMKDLLANILLCTYNDGEFWGGARYWIGERPSKATNMFQWMNSDNIDEVWKGFGNLFDNVINTITGVLSSKESAIELLKKVIKGGVGMAFASVLNAMGRPGIPYCNSLLSNSPVGQWHLTIGHPMNPIMTIGNLICTGVDINFPDNTLGYGDFPTTIKATVKLKPAMPLDRAGIEKIFNHGKGRIYLPTLIKATAGKSTGRHRAVASTKLDKSFVSSINNIAEGVKDKATEVGKSVYNGVQQSDYIQNSLTAIENSAKYVVDKSNKVWVKTTEYSTNFYNENLKSGVDDANSWVRKKLVQVENEAEYLKTKANNAKSKAKKQIPQQTQENIKSTYENVKRTTTEEISNISDKVKSFSSDAVDKGQQYVDDLQRYIKSKK